MKILKQLLALIKKLFISPKSDIETRFIPGCISSPEDKRDFITTAIIPEDTDIPSKFFWNIPFIRNQGIYGSCVGFGSAGLKNVQENIQDNLITDGLSPLFIYTLCKQQDGIPNQEGTYIRLAMQNLLNIGIATEKELPYWLLRGPFEFPYISEELKTTANKYKIKSYASVPLHNLKALKLALQVSPVVAGFYIYSNFFSLKNGFVLTPEDDIAGGHCVLFDGYDDDMTYTYPNKVTKKGFIRFSNSWGTNWGDNGYGYISYDDFYNSDLIFEMWSSVDDFVSPPTPTKYYKVQIGAFKIKTNCESFVIKVKDAGFSTYMPPADSDGLYRVQIGAFNIKENAEALKAKLIGAGFKDAFIAYK